MKTDFTFENFSSIYYYKISDLKGHRKKNHIVFMKNFKINFLCNNKITKGEGSKYSTTPSKQNDVFDNIILKLLKLILIVDFLIQILIPHLKELITLLLS